MVNDNNTQQCLGNITTQSLVLVLTIMRADKKLEEDQMVTHN